METYTQLRQTLHNSGLSEEEQKNMFALLQRTHLDQRHDEAYMHCLLRPEDAVSARIPTEYGRHSATVKQQQTYYINSGTNGEGLLAFLPQDLHFRSLVFVDADMTDLASSNVERFQSLNAIVASALGLEDYFAFARVVGASMRVSFVGESDEESGLFVGGHCYDYNVGLLDANKVDTSYHVQKVRPSKGLRLVYMPRADIDFDYTSLDTQLRNQSINQPVTVFGNQCHNYTPTQYQWTTLTSADTLLEKTLQIYSRGTSLSGTPVWLGPPVNEIRAPLAYIGTGPRSNNYNVQDRQILAFYWKGLLANKTSIRVDIVRHFEVIPRVQFREIIGVSRPLHDTRSMEIAKQIGARSSPVVASSLEKDEDLKHAITSMILKADTGDSLVKAIHNILWVPGWNNPVGDFAKIMNAPQKAITEAMGIDQEELGKKAIKYGVETVKPLVMGMAAEAIKGVPFL